MRTALILVPILALLPAVASAQTATSDGSNPQPAAAQPNPSTTSNGANGALVPGAKLEEGANSFTEGQVRSRAEAAGLKSLAELKNDSKGIWRGNASYQGKSVRFGVDFKGNVALQ